MIMGYYSEKLSGERLRACYEIAPPRVRRHLEAEIAHVAGRIGSRDTVLELGCGYGRVSFELAAVAGRVVGIDTAAESLSLGRRLAGPGRGIAFIMMDATEMGFPDRTFDMVVCVQNGVCAFNVDRKRLLEEALRVCRTGGRILFSSYAEMFWPHRLEWFKLQSAHGLLGRIDEDATGNGTIVCKDGFRAGFMGPAGFRKWCLRFGLEPEITEVDGSITFCEIIAPP